MEICGPSFENFEIPRRNIIEPSSVEAKHGRKNLGPTLLTCRCSEWKGMQFYTKHLLAFFKQNQTPRNARSNHVSVSQASVYLPFLHHCTADRGPVAPLQNGASPASTASCCVGGTDCSCWGSACAACVSVKQLLKATLLVCQECSQFRLPPQL